MLAAFVLIALGAREEYRRSGSLTGAFGGLYLEQTLARIDRWHAGAIAAVASAQAEGRPVDRVLDQLRNEGATNEEVALLAGTAEELRGSMRRSSRTCRPWSRNGSGDRTNRAPHSPARSVS